MCFPSCHEEGDRKGTLRLAHQQQTEIGVGHIEQRHGALCSLRRTAGVAGAVSDVEVWVPVDARSCRFFIFIRPPTIGTDE